MYGEDNSGTHNTKFKLDSFYNFWYYDHKIRTALGRSVCQSVSLVPYFKIIVQFSIGSVMPTSFQ